MSSRGALSAPTEGTSFFIVDVVFVKCGFLGLNFWISPCASELAWRLSVVLSAERGKEVERKREEHFEITELVVRSGRSSKREVCIVEVV